jgi:hypothetical protein
MFKAIKWQKLNNELISTYGIKTNILDSLNYYEIVHALIDGNGDFLKLYPENSKRGYYCIFTKENGHLKLEQDFYSEELKTTYFQHCSHFTTDYKTKKVMLGHLMESLREHDIPQTIKVNPIWVRKEKERLLMSEEVLFAPIFDQVTKKYLISDPSDAIALLAVSPEEQKRFGIELTFYMITNRDLPDEIDKRAIELRNRIDGLSFMIPRIPQKKGSGTFFVTIINLENPLEEMAFIRNYSQLDSFANCLFVTSDFKMRDGNLQEIHYDGEQIDTIFMPMIEWQKSIRTSHQF